MIIRRSEKPDAVLREYRIRTKACQEAKNKIAELKEEAEDIDSFLGVCRSLPQKYRSDIAEFYSDLIEKVRDEYNDSREALIERGCDFFE